MYKDELIIPKDEILNRIERLKQLMGLNGLDYVLILQNADIFYFSGILQQGFILIPLKGESIYFVRRNIELAKKYSPLKVERLKSNKQILEYIDDNTTVGMELDVLPFQILKGYEKILKVVNAKIEDCSAIIKEVRQIKSELEINFIRKAGLIIKNVFMELKNFIESNKTEYEILCYAQNIAIKNYHQGFMRMRGFNQEMYFGHILSGESGITFGYPNAPTSGFGIYPSFPQGSGFRKVKRGEIVSVDLVGCYNGYHCDQTRPFAVGIIKREYYENFNRVKEIIEYLEDFIKPGVLWEEAYFKANEIAKKMGVEKNFMGYKEDKVKFIGHGVGVEVDEQPFLAPGFKKEFKENMVMAIEPKLFFPVLGVIGIENTYLVTKDGLERLTPCENKIF